MFYGNFDSVFSNLFNEFFSSSTNKRMIGSGNIFDELLSSKSIDKSKDYEKKEQERFLFEGKIKEVQTVETWTDENGYTCKSVSVKRVPNISEDEMKKENRIQELKKMIKDAVQKEEYGDAAKYKEELLKLEGVK